MPRGLGYETVTVSTSAIGLSSVPDFVTGRLSEVWAVVSVETSAIRVRFDGTNPTSTVGLYIAAGSTATFASDLGLLKMIRDTAAVADAKVSVHYEGY